MGSFRLLLAFCVVLAHGLDVPIPAATADMAVQAFYIVSGFYMGLILTEKYHEFSPFFTNRLLRLYPVYFTVLIATVAHSILRMAVGRSPADPGLLPYLTDFHQLNLASRIYLVATNVVLWGQDIALFLRLPAGGHALAFTTNFAASSPPVFKFLLVPQAWSLSIELCFYLLAPWLVLRSTKVLIALVAATVAGRVLLALSGLSFDPWTYRFFPVEVGLFVLGILIYRSMGRRKASVSTQRIAWLGLLLATLTVSAVPGAIFQRLVFYGYCCWALPLVFQVTRHNRVDRYIGELSYPIYLSHILVIGIALYSHLSGPAFHILVVVLVLGASVLLQELVQKPVDRYRNSRLTGSDAEPRIALSVG